MLLLLLVWRQIPKQWRKDYRNKRKAIGAFLIFITFNNIAVCLVIYGILFSMIPTKYQPILALVLPLTREASVIIQRKLGKKELWYILYTYFNDIQNVSKEHTYYCDKVLSEIWKAPGFYIILPCKSNTYLYIK